MRSHTQTLIGALRTLSGAIQSPDGVASACLSEAANRMEELARCRAALVAVVGSDDPAELRLMAAALTGFVPKEVRDATGPAIEALLASRDPDRPCPGAQM